MAAAIGVFQSCDGMWLLREERVDLVDSGC